MSERIFNFSAGPAILPEEVLRTAQQAVWNLGGSGIGVLEHSHRGAEFSAVRYDRCGMDGCHTSAFWSVIMHISSACDTTASSTNACALNLAAFLRIFTISTSILI